MRNIEQKLTDKQKLLFDIYTKYYIDWADHRYWKNTNDKHSQFEQNASNCWLYAYFNNLYFSTWYKITQKEIGTIKDLMKKIWINTENWWMSEIAGVVLARYMSYIKKKVCWIAGMNLLNREMYEHLKDIEQPFVASRISNRDLYKDVDDDWIINQYHWNNLEDWRHAINIYWDKQQWMFKELWSWWDDSKYNTFYYTENAFLDMLRCGAIRKNVSFIYPFDWKNYGK